jgi:hypothetical protein
MLADEACPRARAAARVLNIRSGHPELVHFSLRKVDRVGGEHCHEAHSAAAAAAAASASSAAASTAAASSPVCGSRSLECARVVPDGDRGVA